MTSWDQFVQTQITAGAVASQDATPACIARYGDLHAEYKALGAGPAIVDRSTRAVLEVTGNDRAGWLHNLTTNQVKSLGNGEGNYVFVLNLQGRILFDATLHVKPDAIWVVLDRRSVDTATAHLNKYIIMEDVTVTDHSRETVVIGLAGTGAKEVLASLGAPHALTMAAWSLAELSWTGKKVPFIRHDFCGGFAVELFVSPDVAVELWQALCASSGCTPAGDEAVQMHRIEAGIPWPGNEITDEYLPAETGLLGKAVSFNKGCYLGQEVVERMRARGVVARKLVGLLVEGRAVPDSGSAIEDANGRPIGTLTSACHSIGTDRVIGLGYVKTAAAAAGSAVRLVWEEGRAEGMIAELPFLAGDKA